MGEIQDPTVSGPGLAAPDRDQRAFVHWSLCAAAAILAHGLLGALMLRWQTEPDAVAPGATIVLELSPVVAAPQVLELETPPVPEQVQAENPQDKVVEGEIEEDRKITEEKFEPRLEVAELQPEAVPLRPPEARRDVDAARIEPPAPQTPIVTIEEKSDAELARTPKQTDSRQTDVAGSPPASARPHEQTAQPKQTPLRKPVPDKPHRQAPSRTNTRPQVARAEVAASQAPAAGTPRSSNALPNWRSQIIGILERNKRYPPEAQARQERGVSNLAFSLNRQGRVTSAHIAGSSGSAALDAETLALVRRVQPFPPPPPEVAGAQIGLVVAIRYR